MESIGIVSYSPLRGNKDSQLTVSSKERDGSTLGTGTTSSANTMDVVLRVVRVVIVEHVGDILDVFKRIPVSDSLIGNDGRVDSSNPAADVRSIPAQHATLVANTFQLGYVHTRRSCAHNYIQ